MVENDLRRIVGFLLRMIGSSGSERRAQTADAPQCSAEIGNVRVARRQAQHGYSAGPNQLGRDQEQSLPEALQGRPLLDDFKRKIGRISYRRWKARRNWNTTPADRTPELCSIG